MSFSLAFLRTSECIEIGSLQLAKKFAVNTVQHETELQTKHELQSPLSTYIPDTMQILMKKKALATSERRWQAPHRKRQT